MPNSHGTPDSLFELQAVSGDLLPACVISQTFPSVPVPPGMTLAAFATSAYIREGPALVYTRQDAQPLTLTGADGTYWAAISTDTWTDFAQWTRQPGTHYLWRPNSTQPADVDGLLVAMQLTVAGGAITAVTPIASRATLAAAWRGLLALGSMATQNADAVAITGGTATGLTSLVTAAGLTAQFLGSVGVQAAPVADAAQRILYRKDLQDGLRLQATITDTAGGANLSFLNVAGTLVGRIYTDASTTTYATTSDGRLKEAVQPLEGALAVVQALRPVQFRWKASGAVGHGLLAEEVRPLVPEAVVGQVGDASPLGLDASKLVPWLIGACQTLAQQVEGLTARLRALEGA